MRADLLRMLSIALLSLAAPSTNAVLTAEQSSQDPETTEAGDMLVGHEGYAFSTSPAKCAMRTYDSRGAWKDDSGKRFYWDSCSPDSYEKKYINRICTCKNGTEGIIRP